LRNNNRDQSLQTPQTFYDQYNWKAIIGRLLAQLLD
jgi:hypothetical protein